jgi:hypothetical protein
VKDLGAVHPARDGLAVKYVAEGLRAASARDTGENSDLPKLHHGRFVRGLRDASLFGL